MFDKQSNIVTRNGSKEDLPFLYEMLFEAFHWNSTNDRPSLTSFFDNPEFSRLLTDWGRRGDTAVIAEMTNEPIGAAWYRFWTDEDHSYGYLESHIPEIGMAVRSNHRSRGVGRLLIRSLKSIARTNQIKKVTLSVDPKNYALLLYESEGFAKYGESGTSWTMICELNE